MNLSKETKELLAANGFNVDPRFTYPLRRVPPVRWLACWLVFISPPFLAQHRC